MHGILNQCDITTHYDIKNGTQNGNRRLLYQNFAQIGLYLAPTPLKSSIFNQKSVKMMHKLNFEKVWTRSLNRYEKNFDCDVWGNHSAVQNGLIYDFVRSSYLTMVENVKEGALKSSLFTIQYLFLEKLQLPQL